MAPKRFGLIMVAVLLSIPLVPTPAVAASSPTVAVGSASIVEGDVGTRTVTFPVTLSQPSPSTVSVHYAVTPDTQVGGTAATSSDFKPVTGTLTFKVNLTTGVTQVEKFVTVTVFSDGMPEPEKSFAVTLSQPSVGLSIFQAVGTGKIIDDDPPTGLKASVGDETVFEGRSGSARVVKVPVTLSSSQSQAVDVSYSVSDGTATQGIDYRAKRTGTLRFPAGSRSKTITVQVLNDSIAEGYESLNVTLTGTTTGAIGRSGGLVGIIDDPYTGAVGGPRVAVIGDSITFVAGGNIRLSTLDAYQTWLVGIPGYTIGNALPQLTQQLATAPAAVVVNLGSDDVLDNLTGWRTNYDTLVTMVQSTPCVIFVNINDRITNYYASGKYGTAVTIGTDINQALYDTIANHANMHLIDWKTAVDADATLTTDGLHPSTLGSQWLGAHTRSALDTWCSA